VTLAEGSSGSKSAKPTAVLCQLVPPVTIKCPPPATQSAIAALWALLNAPLSISLNTMRLTEVSAAARSGKSSTCQLACDATNAPSCTPVMSSVPLADWLNTTAN
jgi:hypothetical protein